MELRLHRKECLEKNEFNCNDYHCMFYSICEKESVEAFKEEWDNLQRKGREEEKAIKEWLK